MTALFSFRFLRLNWRFFSCYFHDPNKQQQKKNIYVFGGENHFFSDIIDTIFFSEYTEIISFGGDQQEVREKKRTEYGI